MCLCVCVCVCVCVPLSTWLVAGWSFSMGSAYQFHSWRVFVVVCALPCVSAVVALTFMPESPRFFLQVSGGNVSFQCKTSSILLLIPVANVLNSLTDILNLLVNIQNSLANVLNLVANILKSVANIQNSLENAQNSFENLNSLATF